MTVVCLMTHQMAQTWEDAIKLKGFLGDLSWGAGTAIFDGILMRIGLAILFGITFNMKHYGFWLGDALAGFTPFIIGIIFYFSGKWKK